MDEEKSLLEIVMDERAASSPQYAADRVKMDLVDELILLRRSLGLTQANIAERMGVKVPRVSEIESKPDKVSLDRIQAYAKTMGASLALVMPGTPAETLSARIGVPAIDVKSVDQKLRELAKLLRPLADD